MNPYRPRKLRIAQSGWENYTGVFGNIEFVDGVSVLPVTWHEQQRLGAIVLIESAEDEEVGAQVSPSAELLRMRDMTTDDDIVAGADAVVMVGDEARLAAETYTRQELEDIADAKGLLGLRDIAKTWGVKGRSIAELINGIIDVQVKGGGKPETDQPKENTETEGAE